MNREMMIKTESNYFRVKWVEAGWSYATPRVYLKKKYPLIPLSRWVHVWDGDSKGFLEAQKMLPEEIRKWFTESVEHCEKYNQAWNSE